MEIESIYPRIAFIKLDFPLPVSPTKAILSLVPLAPSFGSVRFSSKGFGVAIFLTTKKWSTRLTDGVQIVY